MAPLPGAHELAAAGLAGVQGLSDLSLGPAELCQLGVDASLDLLQAPPLRDTAGTVGAVGGERIDDLSEGEAQLLELPSEAHPLEVVLVERAVATCRAGCRPQDARRS